MPITSLLPLLLAACAPERDSAKDTAEYCDAECAYDRYCPATAENGWELLYTSDSSVTADLVRRARCMFGSPIEITVNGEVYEDCWELVEGDRSGQLDWDTYGETCESF